MHKYFLLYIFLLISYVAKSQSENSDLEKLEEYVEVNLTEVSSILLDNNTYDDLEPLKLAIGDSRVVMLGEQDHGDAPTFLAKARIIKYLHEQMGFEVLAFESDFFGLNRSWEELLDQRLSLDDVFLNIFPIWTICEQAQPVFNYIRECFDSDNRLIVTGIDCQDHQKFARENLVPELDNLLKTLNIPFVKSNEYQRFISLLPVITAYDPKALLKESKKSQKFLFTSLDIVKTQLLEIRNPDLEFWIQVIRSIRADGENLLTVNDNSLTADNVRDTQMGNNLLWLVKNKFPNKKIIVWLHSQHAAKNMNIIVKTKKEMISVGRVVHDSLQTELYVLGFTCYSGSAGRLTVKKRKTYAIKEPTNESIEHFINKKGYDYALLDFRNGKEQLGLFKMKGVSPYEIHGDWPKVLDGIFYIKDMYPCDRIEQ